MFGRPRRPGVRRGCQVIPDTELVPLRGAVQQRIAEDARTRLGVQNSLRINLTVYSMEADGRKIEEGGP